jgi:DNA-binding winged helix-turn-helix (wHTH) protein/Tfp pilus assembly protein PilF
VHGKEVEQLGGGTLAQRAQLILGELRVDPGTRTLEGPADSAVLRPQVMLVFMVLIDADGAVVTRDELAQRAWSQRFVADDSLNGAISEIRRALRKVGADGVELLTVTKTGYRLAVRSRDADSSSGAAQLGGRISGSSLGRRFLLGAIGGGALAGVSLWGLPQRREKARVEALIERGLIALRQGMPDHRLQGVDDFRQAASLAPDNARVFGLLALALKSAAEYGPSELVAPLRLEAEAAARRALAIERQQPDALTALALLEPSFGRWGEAEQRLRAILAQAPDNPFAIAGLATLLMSTGQVAACLARLDWLNARHPLSPNLQFRRVYTLWSAGRLGDADATADRALQQWPRHPAVWFARMWTFAFTGRAERAQAMLANVQTRPTMPPPVADLFALSLAALKTRKPSLSEQAITANMAAAARGPGPAVAAIMILSALGAGAQALEVARGFLLQKGAIVVRQGHTPLQPSVTDHHHRMTMMLWIPVCAHLRRQAGFAGFCDDLGLTQYWRMRGIQPDYLRQALVS